MDETEDKSYYYEYDYEPDSTSDTKEDVYTEDDTVNMKSTKWG